MIRATHIAQFEVKGTLTTGGSRPANRGAKRRFRGDVERLLAEALGETRRRLNPDR